MQQAIHRLRWQVDHRNLHINKPLPVLNNTTADPRSGKPTRTSNIKSSKSSPKPLQSPIPTISVDTSALHVHPPYSAQRNAQLLSPSSASSSRRHSSFSPVSNPSPSPSTGTRERPHRRQRIPTQAVIAVMDFLEQQEREMHVEVQRVAAEIRELRRCVRTVKRERASTAGAGRRETPGMGMESSWSGSGSDADTEESDSSTQVGEHAVNTRYVHYIPTPTMLRVTPAFGPLAGHASHTTGIYTYQHIPQVSAVALNHYRSDTNTIMSDDIAVNTSAPTAPRAHRRHSSFDEQTVRSLEKQLAQRPDKHDLVERNILKDDRVAPALQAAREQLEKSQLQDKLGQAISHRPKPEELVKEGILQPEEVPTPA